MHPIRKIVSTAAFAAAMAFAVTAPASAADCKAHSHTASASGGFEGLTAVKARAAWRNEVRQHEGVAWTLWRYARFKTTRCSKAGEKGQWTCVARARPCRAGS